MFEVGDKGRLDYSKFDNVDTDILEALLRADFDAPEAERMEPEAALYILNLLAERQENEEAAEQFDVAAAKAEFDEKYYPLLEDEEKLQAFLDDMGYQEESQEKVVPLKPWVKHWRRFASAAAVFVIFMFAGSVTAYALGFDPVKFVGRWNDDQFWFEKISVTQELADKLSEYDNTLNLVPKWLPDYFKFENIEVAKQPDGDTINSSFIKTNGDEVEYISINYIQELQTSQKFYEKIDGDVIEYVESGIKHYILLNSQNICITWLNGNFECSIIGKFSVDEAKQIINSIYKE